MRNYFRVSCSFGQLRSAALGVPLARAAEVGRADQMALAEPGGRQRAGRDQLADPAIRDAQLFRGLSCGQVVHAVIMPGPAEKARSVGGTYPFRGRNPFPYGGTVDMSPVQLYPHNPLSRKGAGPADLIPSLGLPARGHGRDGRSDAIR